MSASTAASTSLAPLLVVMGATGTGKSQLAVDLAQRFDGEIINGDAMQLYDGLPITTNKMPLLERRGIPHHLLGCLTLREQPWTVDRFVPKALQVMDEIRARGKVPILVGGTHYYTQSLLFRDALVKNASATSPTAELDTNTNTAEDAEEATGKYAILDAPTEQILAMLREVDPVMADRWHPNDRRKIRRSLEIYLQTGKRASEVYDAQTQTQTQSSLPGLRFRTLIFWTHATKDILTARLNARVDQMVSDGLLAEAESVYDMQKELSTTGTSVDMTRGIWVAIGYKEFLPYLEAKYLEAKATATVKVKAELGELEQASETQESERLQQQQLTNLYDQGIERTKIHTSQYASYQIKWIRNKLLPALSSSALQSEFPQPSNSTTQPQHLAKTYILDASDPSPSTWATNVLFPATRITQLFLDLPPLSNSTTPIPSFSDSPLRELPDPMIVGGAVADFLTPKSHAEVYIKMECRVCGVTTVSQREWDVHIGSRRHKNNVRRWGCSVGMGGGKGGSSGS